MFEYFRNYPWNLALMIALHTGGVISEIDDACRPLRDVPEREADRKTLEWAKAWCLLGEKLNRQANRDEAANHRASAARKYLRGAMYYVIAERPLAPADPLKLETYRLGLEAFRKGIDLSSNAHELIEVPYASSFLPAIFVPAATPRPAPCVIHFNGLDSIKEFNYLTAADDWSRRGLACLFVDQPGTGGALRLNGLPAEIESERPASACIDYLQKRGEVDRSKIGICGISLGGYYAPRAAAFEKRLKFCVAHGAVFDVDEVLALRAQQGEAYARSVPHFDDHIKWVLGVTTREEAAAKMHRFTLKGVAEKITCPILIIHGRDDRQVPVEQAHKAYDAAVNSSNRKLIVLGPEDGGVEHCSVDNLPLVIDLIADWIIDTVEAQGAGVAGASDAR
jgi:dienelactone hydrolase